MSILLIDNNDSFTYNLEHLLVKVTGFVPAVIPYDRLHKHAIEGSELIVISPGPRRPTDYPAYNRIFNLSIPILGICLGMQIINEQFGGSTDALPGCFHGRAEEIHFDGRTCSVARYHSLYANTVGRDLEVIGSNDAGIPMALSHRHRPIIGYQFHPESFLTPSGEFFIEYALDSFADYLPKGLFVGSLGA